MRQLTKRAFAEADRISSNVMGASDRRRGPTEQALAAVLPALPR